MSYDKTKPFGNLGSSVLHEVKLTAAHFATLREISGGKNITLLCHSDGSVTWEVRDYDGNVLEDPLTRGE